MVSFELGKEIEKDVFSYGHEGKTKKKILSPQGDLEFFHCLTLVTIRKTSSCISVILFEQLKTNNIPSTDSDLQRASLSSTCSVEQDVSFFLKLLTSIGENVVQFGPNLSSKEKRTGSEYEWTIISIFRSENLSSPPISLFAIATAKVEGAGEK